MYISTKYLHVFLDIGDALLSSGAEIFRVEDTLNRMGYACGATQMNVFVITSSIVITMEFPEENVRTQTRRIRKTGGNDFEKLEKLNNLSRQFCQNPMSPEELREAFDRIDKVVPTQTGKLAGSILAAFSFALFYGGNLWDALLAGLAGILIWGAQRHIRKYCMNEVTFQFVASFLTGCFICVMARLFPALHVDKIMIGDIMLLIPGLMATNAIRDILIGDTISGVMRFIEAMLLAAVLALGLGGLVDDVYCSIIYRCSGFGCIWHIVSYEEETPSIGGTWRFSGLAVIYHLQRILGRCVLPDIGSSFWNRLICGDTCA